MNDGGLKRDQTRWQSLAETAMNGLVARSFPVSEALAVLACKMADAMIAEEERRAEAERENKEQG